MPEIQKYNHEPSKYLRDKIIEQLKDNFAANNLEVRDFEHRMEVAHQTRDKEELNQLVSDLPEVQTERETGQKSSRSQAPSIAYELNPGATKATDTIFAIFSSSKRNGLWTPARHLELISAFGSTTLDFRKARLNPGVTKITAISVFGLVDIIVPPGVNIETSGVGIFGNFESSPEQSLSKQAPTLQIEGVSVFGSVTIKVKA